MKTHFELVHDPIDVKSPYHIIQRFRTVYYEDVVNPKKYRDCLTLCCETEEMANKILVILNEKDNLFTSEWLGNHRKLRDNEVVKKTNGGKTRVEYKIYSTTNSRVNCEADLYNGADQSVWFKQLMKDKKGKYSSKSTEKMICRFWDSDYAPIVLELWSKKNNQLFFDEQ
jgi:hypothetical protein